MNVLNAVAHFERDLSNERTQSGLKRARLEGTALPPSTLSEKKKQDVRDDLASGLSVSAVARKYATRRQTIMRAQ
ncbi:DNA invertase Pin-like site-specific DNA recombinase [Shinella sp. BE166]